MSDATPQRFTLADHLDCTVVELPAKRMERIGRKPLNRADYRDEQP